MMRTALIYEKDNSGDKPPDLATQHGNSTLKKYRRINETNKDQPFSLQWVSKQSLKTLQF